MTIFNENKLLESIRRIVREELEKEYPKDQVDSIWKYLNKLNEKIDVQRYEK